MKPKRLGRALNLIGDKYGRLTVLERAPSQRKPAMWRCACRCGNETVVRADRLKSGRTKSCGCIHDAPALIMQVAAKEYRAWHGMQSRVDSGHKNYGGRGIKVAKRWRRFENFLSDMGPAPSDKHSLDRENNDGHYEPGNCRWATHKQQMRNTSVNVKVRIDGKLVALIDLSEKAGLNRKTVIRRLERGWTVMDALSLPTKTWLGRDDYPLEWLLGIFTETKKTEDS